MTVIFNLSGKSTHVLYVDFAFIHKLHQILDVHEFDVLENDDRVLFGVAVGQNGIEVCAARRQHDAVCLQCLTVARQRNIAKASAIEQL